MLIDNFNNFSDKLLNELEEKIPEIYETNENLKEEINEFKNIDISLKNTKLDMFDIIDFLPDATFIIDNNGIVVAWNRAIEEMTGIKAEDMVDKGNHEYALAFYGQRRPMLIDLILKSEEEIKKYYYSVKKYNHTLLAENLVSTLKGKRANIWGKASPLYNTNGEIVGTIETIRDVTEFKQIEEKLLNTKKNLERVNKRLKNLSVLDGLTKIFNRRRFDEFLQYEWKSAIRRKTPLSLIMIDIDFFKAFNDTYGHQAGDNCLKQVAKVLSKTLKRSEDFIGRYGGEEFVVVVKGMSIKEVNLLAESLRKKVEKLDIEHISSKVSKFVTVSLGVSTIIPSIDSSPSELIESADNALYQAKQNGRNRVQNVSLIK